MKKFNLIMLSGLPGSGKTTIRETILELFPEFSVLSTDDYIESRCKNYTIQTYNDAFRTHFKDAKRHLHNSLNHHIQEFKGGNESRYVICDQTNLTDNVRKGKLESIKQRCCGDSDEMRATLIFVDTDFDTILERNRERMAIGRHLPEKVLRDMFVKFDKTKTDGFCKYYSINGLGC
jgi:tRNA uridine 5-carbamoylmethylation protein Kti12